MRPHKYGVAPAEQRTMDGIVFHSKKEMQDYQRFAILLKAGSIKKLELQVKFPLLAFRLIETSLQGLAIPVAKYIADFVVTELDGTRRIYDSKGVQTPTYRLKRKIFEANYPDLRIVEI